MCGVVKIFGKPLEIDCELIDPEWWRPVPPVDFTRFKFPVDSPSGSHPDPWKSELTKITEILSIAHRFSDRDLSDRLAKVAVEIGNNIAERAQVDVQFDWQA